MNKGIQKWNELSAIEKILKVKGSGLRDEIYEKAYTELSTLRTENKRLRLLHKDCERIAAYLEQNFNSRDDLRFAVRHLLEVAKALKGE